VIPETHEYLSFLMGGAEITDADLTDLGVTILERHGEVARVLLVPAASLPGYSAILGDRLSPGFWNELVGRQEILFIFKLADGTTRQIAYSEATSSKIARLCSLLNGDPIETTSDVPRYLAGNPLYRDLIAAFHAGDRPHRPQDVTSGPA
jgi:hypothetical protein